jgi:hypothetical protein
MAITVFTPGSTGLGANRIVQNPSDARTKILSMQKLAGAYYPGQIVYESALGVWTIQATNAGQTARSGVVMDTNRKYAGTTKTIDTQYAQNDLADICIVGDVACFITDQSGAKLRGQNVTLSSTAGSLTSQTDGTLRNLGHLLKAVANGQLRAYVRFNGEI